MSASDGRRGLSLNCYLWGHMHGQPSGEPKFSLKPPSLFSLTSGKFPRRNRRQLLRLRAIASTHSFTIVVHGAHLYPLMFSLSPYPVFSLIFSVTLLSYCSNVIAANADDWRSRSIYQIIVDRYALPPGSDLNSCDPGMQSFCGGTWNTIRENLDYIQNAGFTAVWISPVSKNYEGQRTPYGDPYHGYWISDASQLNDKFGTSDDLKALSNELHNRGMYLMVDVVVNNVMSLSATNMDYSQFMFKDESLYHPYCPIDWGNRTSEQDCWLGDTEVYLPDVKTEDPAVVSGYNNWIKDLVQEYNIDGLRIDAAKHVNTDFWPGFCASAGVFCIGEVFDADPAQASEFQGPNSLDSILHYPMYNAIASAFAIPGPQNMSAMSDMISRCKSLFKDPTLLGNFLENQDVPRWGNISVDPQSLYNAMVYNFMSDGIPIVYYGQEQGFRGAADPYNREPLWTSGYNQTTVYNLSTTLNQFRNYLVSTSDWAKQSMDVLTQNEVSLAIKKGDVITVVTNVGSPPSNSSIPIYTGLSPSTILIEILSCTQYSVGSAGSIQVTYSQGGHASVFYEQEKMKGVGLCGYGNSNNSIGGTLTASTSGAISRSSGYITNLIWVLFMSLGLLNNLFV